MQLIDLGRFTNFLPTSMTVLFSKFLTLIICCIRGLNKTKQKVKNECNSLYLKSNHGIKLDYQIKKISCPL